jgi:hypothetical protein
MTCYGHHKGSRNLDGASKQTTHLNPANRQDAFSPFRYFMRKARNRKHETDLDLPYLKALWETQGGRCALSGIEMVLPRNTLAWEKQTDDPWKPSLDRIDSSKGYTMGNVRYVTVMANLAKSRFSDEQLRRFCQAVAANSP